MKLSKIFINASRVSSVLIAFFIITTAAIAQTVSPGGTIQSIHSKVAPVIDARIDALEWEDAQQINQNLDLYTFGGTKVESHPLSLYIKNDDQNLYIAGSLIGEEHDGSMQIFNPYSLSLDFFMIAFDNNDNGRFQAGEDKKTLYILNQSPFLKDEHLLTSSEQRQGQNENSEPQDTVGGLTYSQNSSTYTFELAIPLASGDASDIQIQPGEKVRWNLFFMDKFNLTFSGTTYGGLSGRDWTNTAEWTYIELGVPQVVAPPANPSQDIQVFAALMNASDLSQERLQFIGSHYDLVLTAFPIKQYVDPLKNQNSDLPILLFNNPYFSFGEQFWNATSTTELNQIIEQYSLKAPNNQTINYGGPTYSGFEQNQQVPLMDIRNPLWQDYFASQSRKFVDTAGLDGLFLDTFEQTIPAFALAEGNQYPKNYTASGWKASTDQFLSKIKNAFEGTQSTILFNGISRGPGSPSGLPNEEILDQLEGGAIETYSIYRSMDESDQTKSWYFYQTIMQDFKEAGDKDKWVIMEAYGDRDDDQTRLYALCSFLLIQRDNTFFYFTRKDQAGALHWRPEWDVKLGKPLGPYQELANGAFSRDFEQGKVLVNPLSTNVSVLGLSSYQDWKSGQQVNNLTLPPFSGTLLVSNN